MREETLEKDTEHNIAILMDGVLDGTHIVIRPKNLWGELVFYKMDGYII